MSGILCLMLGVGGARITTPPNGIAVDPADANWNVNSDGTYSVSGPGSGNWLEPPNASLAALYEIKVDVTAGSFSSGTTGAWLALSSSRSWTRTLIGSVTFDVSFRLASDGTVVHTTTGRTLQVTA